MTDLIPHLCSIRLEQNEAYDRCVLLPPTSFETWITKADSRLKQLEQQVKTCPPDDRDQITDAHECIETVLSEILQLRADIIWCLAKDGAGNVDLMTKREAEIYGELVGLAEDLRGE